jgi:hypothetical protein
MRRALAYGIFSFLVLSSAAPSSANVIFESASLGDTEVTWEQVINQEVAGSNVASFNFVGARFQVTQAVRATQIGGHFVGGYEETSFFGALVSLTGRDDFPDSGNLSTPDVLGVSILNFPHASADTRGDLSLRLDPGWYAVVFGTYLFGTNGRGATVRNGLDFGMQSYIVWQEDPGWFNRSELSDILQPGNQRIFVEGTVAPEPTTSLLLISAASYLGGLVHRRREG